MTDKKFIKRLDKRERESYQTGVDMTNKMLEEERKNKIKLRGFFMLNKLIEMDAKLYFSIVLLLLSLAAFCIFSAFKFIVG